MNNDFFVLSFLINHWSGTKTLLGYDCYKSSAGLDLESSGNSVLDTALVNAITIVTAIAVVTAIPSDLTSASHLLSLPTALTVSILIC